MAAKHDVVAPAVVSNGANGHHQRSSSKRTIPAKTAIRGLIHAAIREGYRHFDCAGMQCNAI
nr:unnamed protein product [Digitaria exilis]